MVTLHLPIVVLSEEGLRILPVNLAKAENTDIRFVRGFEEFI